MYEQTIFRILKEAGPAGLSVKKIARHVYNEQNTFFSVVDFADVHREVQLFLMRNSRQANAMLEHAEGRGMYRLNQNSPKTMQLMLEFSNDEDEDDAPKPTTDLSLSLFD